MLTPSKADKNKDINKLKPPGYIQGALVNILEYDSDMLSAYGLALASVFKQIKKEDEQTLQTAAKALDGLFNTEE